ncbi:MAG: response regulator [Candidatus Saelkia tenebricola]|nr:response regulator [Candidatus Saelkia tenebricola]
MKENKGKILFVDDDAGILDVVSDFLTLENFEITTVNEGDKALEMLKSSEFDLLITDIKMPGLSGLEVLKKAKEINNEVPVIVVTGFASMETAIEAVKDGAYDYITKPFDMEKFLNITKKAIKQKKMGQENKELLSNLTNLDQQLELKINQIFALGEVSKAVANISDLDTILQAIVNIAFEITKAKNIALLLADDTSKELVVEIFKGFNEEMLRKLRIKAGEGLLGNMAQEKIPITKSLLVAKNIVLGKKELDLLGEGEFLCLPIDYRDKLFGMLVLTEFPDQYHVGEDEIRVLSILSRQASIAIDNSMLYDKLQNKYLTTLEILVAALEAKCKNTQGHSQRVSIYAREFSKFLGLIEAEVLVLERACAVHDIGKIVIPESILAKPDKLSEKEMLQMRTHPFKGADILIPLGIMRGMMPVVRNHHERYDGKGYPDALKNGEIPFEAKLVSIVDAFDAMTSSRSYRRGCLSKKEALAEIESQIGAQFDPDLSMKFLKFCPDIMNHMS